jgi:hypothetical protein
MLSRDITIESPEEELCNENPCDNAADAGCYLWSRRGAGPTIKLQGLQRAAARLHEELCRPDLQVRIQNVLEILQKEIVSWVMVH